MGARRAVVVTSVIWAFWHTPFALSGIHYIEGVSAVVTALIMPIGQAGSGLVAGATSSVSSRTCTTTA
jgi:membrane protease YdiL (CAAX protease family)